MWNETKKLNDVLPKSEPLNETHIYKFAKIYLRKFRGVLMRDGLPKICKKIECGVINLDNNAGSGTHWCSYYKLNQVCYYFDSFGNLPPPKELVSYLGSNCIIYYNYHRFQKYNTFICGHLSLYFLYDIQNLVHQ